MLSQIDYFMEEQWNNDLKGFSALEADVQRGLVNSWVESGIIDKYRHTQSQLDRLYKNKQYVNTFGIDAFKANTDPISRDKEFETYVLNNAIQSKYSEDSNLDKIKNLTNEGLKELLESNYRSPEEIERYKKRENSTNINQGFTPFSKTISI